MYKDNLPVSVRMDGAGTKTQDAGHFNPRSCYQEFTQGFCSGNLILKSFDGNAMACMNNPCGLGLLY